MLNKTHLETSFTTVPGTLLKQQSPKPISFEDFAQADVHFIIQDDQLARRIEAFAMSEGLGLTKLPVGSQHHHTSVEFFWLDLKKGKKELAKLQKLLTVRWLEVTQGAELAREMEGGNLFSASLTAHMEAIEQLVDLRRFLLNALDPTMLAKKKRTALLFHHRNANAPRPD